MNNFPRRQSACKLKYKVDNKDMLCVGLWIVVFESLLLRFLPASFVQKGIMYM